MHSQARLALLTSCRQYVEIRDAYDAESTPCGIARMGCHVMVAEANVIEWAQKVQDQKRQEKRE